MKKLCTALALFTFLIITAPVSARESHAGKPADSGGISITSRESHAGKPTSPSIGVSGLVGSLGSGSRLGGSVRGGGSSPIFSPMPLTVPGTLFNLILFAIYMGPARLF